MQTGTGKGMQTMEQALAHLIQHRVVTFDDGLSRSSRPEQLIGILERAGFAIPAQAPAVDLSSIQEEPSLGAGLRVAGS